MTPDPQPWEAGYKPMSAGDDRAEGLMAKSWPEFEAAMREVWTDESLAKQPFVSPNSPSGTYGFVRKPWYKRLRPILRSKVDALRTRAAIRIAPWLREDDDGW